MLNLVRNSCDIKNDVRDDLMMNEQNSAKKHWLFVKQINWPGYWKENANTKKKKKVKHACLWQVYFDSLCSLNAPHNVSFSLYFVRHYETTQAWQVLVNARYQICCSRHTQYRALLIPLFGPKKIITEPLKGWHVDYICQFSISLKSCSTLTYYKYYALQ